MGKDFTLLILSIITVLSTTFVLALECNSDILYEPQENFEDPSMTTYFICFMATGTAGLMTCPEGLVYNPASKGCALSAGTAPLSECKVEGQMILDPDSADCTTYLRCTSYDPFDYSHLVTVLEPCPIDYIFNHLLGKCVPVTEWICGETRPLCDKEEYQIKYYPAEGECESYYKCFDNVRVKGKCPGNTHFDFFSQLCIPISESVCKEQVKIRDICKGNAYKFIADPNYCIGYYYCINENTPYWSYCSGNTYFTNGGCSSTRPNNCKCEGVDFSTRKVYLPTADSKTYVICEANKQPIVKECPCGYVFVGKDESCEPI